MVRVSVVIPTHNRQHLVGRAIASAQAQTYPDIEILVVDDASTDGTFDVVKGFPNVKYLRLPENGGGGVARNLGVAHSQGDYVAFLDSDDEWLPEKTAKQVAVLDANPKVGAVYSRHFAHDDATGTRMEQHPDLYRGNVREVLLTGRCPKTVSLFTVRRAAFTEVGGFDERLPAFQDTDLWLRMSQSWPFEVIDEALVVVHDHPGPRVTTNLGPRLVGLDRFLDKWNDEMAEAMGSAGVDRYRRRHLATAYGSEVLRLLDDGERLHALGAIRRYFREAGLVNRPQAMGLLIGFLFGSETHRRWRSRDRRRDRLADS